MTDTHNDNDHIYDDGQSPRVREDGPPSSHIPTATNAARNPSVDEEQRLDIASRVSDGTLDLSGELYDENAGSRPKTVLWDPRPMREKARLWFAAASLTLFASIVLILTFAVVFGARKWTDLEGLTAAILPTIASIVSAAVVFYYYENRRD